MALQSRLSILVLLVLMVVGLVVLLFVAPGAPLYRLVHPAQRVTLYPTSPDGAGQAVEGPSRTLKIVTLLPKDAIPAIRDPTFLTGEEAEEQMNGDELVLGLSINDDHRAYSIPLLSNHEIVNDVVGGTPVAVTW